MESQLSYSESQWDLLLALFILAAFSLLALFVFLTQTRSEISPRYRPSAVAGAIIGLIASIAYVFITLSWLTGFDYRASDHAYLPSSSVLQFRNAYRYVDWAVTVPLLCLELIIVSTVAGLRAARMRATAITLAFVMIATGFLGEDTFNNDTGRLVWGLISTVAFIPLYVMLLRTGLRSAKELGEPAGPHLRRATLMLSWTWGVYPLAYCVPFFFATSPEWAVGRQVAFTLADIAAKVGFGYFIHAVAKARTAVDVAAGTTPHPEAIYQDSVKVAEAQPVSPAERHTGSYGHPTTSHVRRGASDSTGRTGRTDSEDAAGRTTVRP